MNRAQRRAEQHRRPQRYFDKALGALVYRETMISAKTSPLPTHLRDVLVGKPDASLTALTAGVCTEDNFVLLVQFNAFADGLARRLHDHSNEKQQFAACLPVFHATADALAAIGERHTRTGQYGASGAELSAVRASVNLLRELLDLSTEGLALQALSESHRNVARYLRGDLVRSLTHA